jgi:hypothetical protein
MEASMVERKKSTLRTRPKAPFFSFFLKKKTTALFLVAIFVLKSKYARTTFS